MFLFTSGYVCIPSGAAQNGTKKTPLCDYCDRYLDCDVIHEQWEGPFLHQNFHFRRKTMEIVMM